MSWPTREATDRILASELVSEDVPEAARNPWLQAVGIVAVLLGLGAVWRWTPLGDWIALERLTAFGVWVRGSPAAPVLVVLAFVLGSFVMVPVTAMIIATALSFDPVSAVVYSMAGGVAASAATYGVGHALGHDTVKRLAGGRLDRLSRRLAGRGVLTVTAARILPLGPFTLVNVVAGASHIRFRHFLLGSFLGLLPGTLAINVFEDGIRAAIREPRGGTFALLGAAVLVFVVTMGVLRRRLAGSERALSRGSPPAA